MSIVIGVKNERFSMLGADTRIRLVDPKDKLYDDELMKLFEVNYGWVSGVGFNVVIISFVNQIQNNNIKSIEDMRDIYKNICKDPENEYKEVDVENTMLTLAYSREESNIVKLEIEIMNQNPKYSGLVSNDEMFVLPPEGLSDNENIRLQNEFKPLIEGNDDLNKLIYHTADYIEKVSKINDNVSDICDFGFMFNTGMGLVTKKHLRGKARDIKETCLKGNIEIYLQERTPIKWAKVYKV